MGYVKTDKDGKKFLVVKSTGQKLYIKDTSAQKKPPVFPRKKGMKFV